MAVPVIVDCDPGHDDALAIILAGGDPRIDLLAITTVAGNQTLEKTTLNARRVCTVAGITGVPVAAGCDRPLVAPPRVAADVHGPSGLDGPTFGEPTVPLAGEHAVSLMRRILLEHPEPVTLVTLGPLTNVATLLRDHPQVRPAIARSSRWVALRSAATLHRTASSTSWWIRRPPTSCCAAAYRLPCAA